MKWIHMMEQMGAEGMEFSPWQANIAEPQGATIHPKAIP